MPCPFLKEGQARYCHAVPVRKLILDGAGVGDGGRCSTPDHVRCELVAENASPRDRCPHLETIRVQYCGVSPVMKLVPFSDSELSRCTSNSYRYCDSYLALSRPHAAAAPPHLLYSSNHFWLDAEEPGLCHIGLDEFLAEAVGTIDAVTFVYRCGTHCPALALTIQGVVWPMTFPNPLIIEKVNARLRSDPSRLTADPYGAGWLFEGWELPGRTRAKLLSGAQGAAWHAQERERFAREIHEVHAPGCDGGVPVGGVARLLSNQEIVALFQHFFSNRDWTAEE